MPNHNKYSHIPGKYYYIIGARKPYIEKLLMSENAVSKNNLSTKEKA